MTAASLDLQPGDVLLFNRRSFFNWLIRIKTWSPYTHVEVVAGPHQFFAARNGQGVGIYAPDLQGLALVLRPSAAFDVVAATKWAYADRVLGQGYDWLGLLNFTYARVVGQDNRKMFCSEAAVRFLRAGGVDPFPGQDADTLSPRDFTLCQNLSVVWRPEYELGSGG